MLIGSSLYLFQVVHIHHEIVICRTLYKSGCYKLVFDYEAVFFVSPFLNFIAWVHTDSPKKKKQSAVLEEILEKLDQDGDDDDDEGDS